MAELTGTEETLTFNDVLLLLGGSAVVPYEVDIDTRLTNSISLNIPLVMQKSSVSRTAT